MTIPPNAACHSQLIYGTLQTQHQHHVPRYFGWEFTIGFFVCSIPAPLSYFLHHIFTKYGSVENINTAIFLRSVVWVKQGHAPCRILLIQHSFFCICHLFLCLYFIEIIRLTKFWLIWPLSILGILLDLVSGVCAMIPTMLLPCISVLCEITISFKHNLCIIAGLS